MATLDLRVVMAALASAIDEGVNKPTLVLAEDSDEVLLEDGDNLQASTAAPVDPTTRPLACYEMVPASTPQFPCAIVRPADQFVAYHESFGAAPLVDVQLEVLIMAQGTSDIDSQIAVLDMLSAGAGKSNSIIDAISADRTLGGVVENTIVRTASGLSRAEGADGSAPVMAVLSVGVKLRR